MTLATPSPLLSLNIVHRLPGRVRFHFRTRAEAKLDTNGMVRAVENLAGVEKVRINLAARSLLVEFTHSETNPDQLRETILALALEARSNSCHNKQKQAELSAVGISGAALLGTHLLPEPLKIPATLIAALPVFEEAAEDLFEKGISSHVLEALAIGISTVSRDYLAANTTSFMLALGEFLEHSIARRSDDLLKELLRPDTSKVWVEIDGQETQLNAQDVEIGMTVIVGAGATIPIDGTTLGGEAMVNEAAMTGESTAVRKIRGDAVLSGTVVEEGRLRIYAEHVGRKTAAARIADYVEHSLTAKSNAQLGASRLADKLVPAVLALAGTTWAWTGDWQRAAAVLQADYSCALKLATPVAFKAAMYRSGKVGILFKGADVLERLAEADTFVFDKTGTLTTGNLAVSDSIAFDPDYSAKDLINLAASVEEHYFHPLALAVVEAARKNQGQHFDHKEVEFIAAHGVASVINGKRIVVGSRHFIEDDEGIDISAHHETVDALFRAGKTLLYIGFGGHLLGVIALKDEIRPETAATIQALRQLGVKKVVMLTGDHEVRAAEMASQLGLDAFHAQLLPEQKAELLEKMNAEGAKIAFIGDGINDAPALANAHVGIAMQKGADIARLTSDLALLEGSINKVAEAKALALAAMTRIDNNFKLTVGANTGILAAAAFGKLTPIASSILHNDSTIAILLNALRPPMVTMKQRRA